MITFKTAIKKWESILDEVMIKYSKLIKKACMYPDKIFVIMFWDDDTKSNEYRSFDVGLKKINGRWVVDDAKFDTAVTEKILAVEDINRHCKTCIPIRYPKNDE